MSSVYHNKMDRMCLSASGKQILVAALATAGEKPVPRPRRVLRTGLLVALIAGLLTLAAGAALLMAPVLRTYFGESGQYVYQKNSQILNLSQTVDGWTMTLTDCVGDDNRLYIGMEVTASEGTVLDAQGAWGAGLGVRDVDSGYNIPYQFAQEMISVEAGTEKPMAWYVNQIPDESETDNHLRFILWANCREPLDGKCISLTVSKIYHGGSTSDGTAIYDFDGAWSFQDIKLDLADQSIRLKPNLSVPVLDTTAILTELTVSPISVMVYFEGSGLIGQQQRYPNGFNIEVPTIVLYDKQGKVMPLQSRYAPFGSRAGSGSNNETGELKIVQGYETFIDLDALDRIVVCGVSIPIK